jgi:hypothetical protein
MLTCEGFVAKLRFFRQKARVAYSYISSWEENEEATDALDATEKDLISAYAAQAARIEVLNQIRHQETGDDVTEPNATGATVYCAETMADDPRDGLPWDEDRLKTFIPAIRVPSDGAEHA